MRKFHALLWSGILALGAGTLAGQSPGPPQPQPPTFRSGVTLVPIDVRVTDRDGRPVTDLRAEEFRVFENGEEQPLSHFSRDVLVSLVPGPSVRAHADVPPFDADAQTRRIFLILIGAGALGSRPLGPGTAIVPDASHALDGLLHLVRDRLLPQDQVALLAQNCAIDFSTDHQRLAALLQQFRERPWATLVDESDDRAAADEGLGLAEYVRTRPVLSSDVENLHYAVKYLRFMPGEKHLIYVTAHGIRRPLPGTVEAGLMEPWEKLSDVALAAADARVAVHVIQTGAVPPIPAPFLAPMPVMRPRILGPGQAQFGASSGGSTRAGSGGQSLLPEPGWDRPFADIPVPIPGMDASGLEALVDLRDAARVTGGRASIMTDARRAVERIDEETRVSYVLAYRPSNPAADGRYRSLRVEVSRPGVTVRFRRGYHAVAETGSLGRRKVLADSRLVAAASSTRALRDIRLSGTAAFARAASGKNGEALLQLTIDPARLTWTGDDLSRRVAHLDVAVFCADARNKTVGQTRGTVDIALTQPRFEEAKRAGLPYSVRVAVNSRPRFAKVVVYDYGADLLGSAVIVLQ